jgi:MoaA/NifB/PqqE/SkfB family radical SAM enzyme
MKKIKTLFRLARAYRAYRRREETPTSLPLRLWVETSTRCNLRCPMCPNKDFPPAMRAVMDFDLFTSIVDQARGFVNDMYLHHRGEPFTHPRLFEMIRYAENAGIRTRFHTNGAMMDREKALRLLEAGPSFVSFSVDGFSKKPYEHARPGAIFEQTLDNILFLARERAARRQECGPATHRRLPECLHNRRLWRFWAWRQTERILAFAQPTIRRSP